MSWDMITAVAVLIGSVAIVASLLYVAQQIKAATRQRRIEWHHAVVGAVDELSKLMAHDHANADIWRNFPRSSYYATRGPMDRPK